MKLYFSESLGILRKTVPFIAARAAVYGIMGLISAGLLLLLLGFYYLVQKIFGQSSGIITLILFIAGIGGFYGIFVIARNYVLYLLKAAHIAVVTEILETGTVSSYQDQVQYGKQVVTDLVKDVSILFILDQLIKGVIRMINRTIARITSWLPISEDNALVKFVQGIVNFSITYVDEAVLSYTLLKKDRNVWKQAQDAIVLYAMNWKSQLLHAVILSGISVVCYVVLLIPSMILFSPFSWLFPSLGTYFFILTLITAYFLKLMLFDPFAMVSIILSFLNETKNQSPNKDWEEKIEIVSDKFSELKKRAIDFVESHKAEKTGETSTATPEKQKGNQVVTPTNSDPEKVKPVSEKLPSAQEAAPAKLAPSKTERKGMPEDSSKKKPSQKKE